MRIGTGYAPTQAQKESCCRKSDQPSDNRQILQEVDRTRGRQKVPRPSVATVTALDVIRDVIRQRREKRMRVVFARAGIPGADSAARARGTDRREHQP